MLEVYFKDTPLPKEELVTALVKHQAMNDLILRIALLLKREDERGFLFFDADAQTIKDSLYALLASVFKKEGVAVGRGEYLEVERIVHYHLLDSKLAPALWIADLFAYGVHTVLEYKQPEIHEKIARVLDKGPQGKTWGYGIKVIPWSSEEDLRRHLYKS